MYRIIVALIVLVAVYKAYDRYCKGHISSRMFLAWLVLWAGVAVFGFVPKLSQHITDVVGIGRGADLFFFFSILFLVYLLFLLYGRIEMMREQITDLVRQLALRDLETPDKTKEP